MKEELYFHRKLESFLIYRLNHVRLHSVTGWCIYTRMLNGEYSKPDFLVFSQTELFIRKNSLKTLPFCFVRSLFVCVLLLLLFFPSIHSLIHPSIHPSIHSFSQSVSRSVDQSFIRLFAHSLIQSFINLCQTLLLFPGQSKQKPSQLNNSVI